MKRALALVLCLAFPPAPGAQELGRLFFTPEQRDALDARRRARVPDKPSEPLVASPTSRLDGYVRRHSDGRATVWVNGDTTTEATPQADGRVPVPMDDSGARVRLKPGQVVDRGSGEVTDVLDGRGEIRVRRPQ